MSTTGAPMQRGKLLARLFAIVVVAHSPSHVVSTKYAVNSCHGSVRCGAFVSRRAALSEPVQTSISLRVLLAKASWPTQLVIVCADPEASSVHLRNLICVTIEVCERVFLPHSLMGFLDRVEI